MSKRDLAFVSATASVDLEPRTKRRKETAEEDIIMVDDTTPATSGGASGVNGVTKEEVKEQGTTLWQTVKDAVNKEGQVLSYEFMRLPSKRQYADYYQTVKRPICLDEIKKHLDQGSYKSLEAVKEDLELCFNNAKKYNLKNSPIWLDAKALHKVAKKEYLRLTGNREDDAADGADEGGEADASGEGKKAKVPNLYRQLKGRLQKLVDKTDDEGRVLSALFMDQPSKKDYPTYYTTIKKPIAFENIFKRLKRKEYETSASFAADVELVFANAFQFNQEGSTVWQDAVTLKEYFSQLMSDLPAPFARPEYAKPIRNKIKLKINGSQAVSSSSPAGLTITGASSFTLRVPGGHEATQSPVVTTANLAQNSPLPASAPLPVAQAQAAPSTSYINQLPVAPMTAQTYNIQPIQAAPRQPAPTYQQYTPHHYPNASYQPLQVVNHTPQAPPPTHIPTSTLPLIEAPSFTKSPSPSNQRPLRGISLVTKPKGRPFQLDHRDGVRSWAMRLGMGENAISVSDVRFLVGEEEEQGTEDEAEEEEEEEEGPALRNGKGKAKRGRGRPRRVVPKVKAPRAAKPRKHITPLQDSVKIMLNGSVVQGKDDVEGQWDMELRLGPNVLEVGEEGGMVWKVYMERVVAF